MVAGEVKIVTARKSRQISAAMPGVIRLRFEVP